MIINSENHANENDENAFYLLLTGFNNETCIYNIIPNKLTTYKHKTSYSFFHQ